MQLKWKKNPIIYEVNQWRMVAWIEIETWYAAKKTIDASFYSHEYVCVFFPRVSRFNTQNHRIKRDTPILVWHSALFFSSFQSIQSLDGGSTSNVFRIEEFMTYGIYGHCLCLMREWTTLIITIRLVQEWREAISAISTLSDRKL